MGLGGAPSEWADYEWVRLADLPLTPRRPPAPEPGYGTLLERLWRPDAGSRVLLVDLDNLRAGPLRWRQRMAMVVAMARQADRAVLAGQEGAVRRGRPYLAEYADAAVQVADGSDLADHVLLDAADLVRGRVQFVVLSNDWIFARLADRGPLTVLSPGADALSDRLRAAATRVVDLAELEGVAAQAPRRTEFRASRRAPAARRSRRRSRTPA